MSDKTTFEKVIEALEEFQNLYNLLQADVSKSLELLKPPNEQFARRVYIRSVFSSIEGTIYRLKQFALEGAGNLGIRLSSAEIALLSEESYELNDKGEPITRPSFLQLQKNLKFSFYVFAKAFEIEYKLKLDDSNWASFLDAIKIRNRIMHPKHIRDTEISDAEMGIIHQTLLWFNKVELEIITMTAETLTERAERKLNRS